jgi:hypothetical protein
MSKPSPTRYRTTNWSSYTSSLRKRGALLIWLDKDMIWLAPHDGSPGRPALVLDALTDLFILRGPAAFMSSYNGAEFIAKNVRA